ncbi:hypothetical protein SPAN111604_15020 [Sphingomonas antarctica]|uniref:hypothetical protein n=1 Tax=Sphingomonas antarctica TaxID=2040274 RepID=UPI0039E879AB
MPRKELDGAKLSADVSKLEREDQTSPPTARPSLMDAVRALATYIEARAKLGWTDAMIAVVLTKAGYSISADTLRCYRKRLRDEGLMAPLPAEGPKRRTRQAAIIPTKTATPLITEARRDTDIVAEASIAVVPAAAPPPAAATIPPADGIEVARAPPNPDLTLTPSPARTFRVDPTKLPPDRA